MHRVPSSVMLACLLAVVACAPVAEDGLHDCRGLADRWVTLQQQILDAVDDPVRDPDANNRHAAAMIEQARDAIAVGCVEDVRVGSALICDRLDLLQPRGPRGATVVADLRSACG